MQKYIVHAILCYSRLAWRVLGRTHAVLPLDLAVEVTEVFLLVPKQVFLLVSLSLGG